MDGRRGAFWVPCPMAAGRQRAAAALLFPRSLCREAVRLFYSTSHSTFPCLSTPSCFINQQHTPRTPCATRQRQREREREREREESARGSAASGAAAPAAVARALCPLLRASFARPPSPPALLSRDHARRPRQRESREQSSPLHQRFSKKENGARAGAAFVCWFVRLFSAGKCRQMGATYMSESTPGALLSALAPPLCLSSPRHLAIGCCAM
jgi:hypothetical protein